MIGNQMLSDAYISPADIPAEFVRQGWTTPASAPHSGAILNMIGDGRIPAEQVNGRYRIDRTTLPEIAALFGLNRQTSNK